MINKLVETKNEVIKYYETNNILNDTCNIIDSAKNYAYQQVNIALVERNWLLGYRIYKEELKEKNRAEYGLNIIKNLAKELTKIYGKGFTKTNLYNFLQFYKYFPNIFHAVRGKYKDKIVDIKYRQSRQILSWTHYRYLIQVHDDEAREWYENEAIGEMWDYRTLARNISSQYYYRLLKSPHKNNLKNNNSSIYNKLEFIKDPVTLEFLEIPLASNLYESDLETSIIKNLQRFLLELGKGYAFVARQQHIRTEKEDYFIDLVFYNYILKCFVLIDLKVHKITHQDVGQMDMYARMYDEFKRSNDDNPTIGILLCSDTDEDIARFSVLHDNEQLFASKYLLYMPTKEELKKEIEREKELYYLNKDTKRK